MSRILLLDDDVALRRGLRNALERNGCLVEEAASVDQAIGKISMREFDLIITDHNLGDPGKTGVSLLLYLRENGLQTPVLFMSGSGVHRLDRISKELGAGIFLSKPFGMQEFLASCRELLSPNSREP